jgi:hypothetical protein
VEILIECRPSHKDGHQVLILVKRMRFSHIEESGFFRTKYCRIDGSTLTIALMFSTPQQAQMVER